MPQPTAVRDLTEELLALYRHAWDTIVAEQDRIQAEWLTLPRARRRERLAQLEQIVHRLMDTADEAALRFTYNNLPQAYLLGAVDSGYTPARWAQPDLDAIGHLATDTYANLLQATAFVTTSTKTLIRQLTREHIADKLITGQTARDAGARLADTFGQYGIAAVTYANGARVGLYGYAEMLTRTQSALAYNGGGYQQYLANDISFVECFDGPDCGLDGHDDPEKPNGGIYDVDVMDELPISHPNCVRSWSARPDIQTAEEAAAASGSATDAQNADQAAIAS